MSAISTRESNKKKRILFIAEAVSLAHASRLLVLAQSLNPKHYEVRFACDPRYDAILGASDFERRAIHTIPTAQFLKSLAKGQPIYNAETLKGYVKEDLELIHDFKPDVIVGDFRISLAVSARIAAIPYVTITNAYWSPFAKIRFPVPDIPLTKIMGVYFGQKLFNSFRPLAFKLHANPFNKVIKHFGLTKRNSNVLQTYTEADFTFYADIPEIVPTIDALPSHHNFLGPILWSPVVPLPIWWNELPKGKPIIYVTMGSSGQSQALASIVKALSELPVTGVIATAGSPIPNELPQNIFAADFLPGEAAALRSDLVICNGGSPTSYQAIAAGVPVIGIPCNLDQYLNMSLVEKANAGILVRSGQVTAEIIKATIEKLMLDPTFKQNVQALQMTINTKSATSRFNEKLDEILGGTCEL